MDVLSITVWREARSQGTAGMTAVYNVIQNRAHDPQHRWPSDPDRVCLQAYQFSCWNTNDPQRNLYPQANDKWYTEVLSIIQLDAPDTTQGANAYFDNSILPPIWADPKKLTVRIGTLAFYKL